jgi:hypothetical protein
MQAKLSECDFSVNGVESVCKVQLENNSVLRAGIAGGPLANSVDSTLGSLQARNANLQRPEKLLGLVLY